MKRFVFKSGIFMAVTTSIVAAILWLLPYSKDYGYHLVQGEDFRKVAWDHHRIFVSDKPIDVAFIGTSQSYYGLQDTEIESTLRNHGIRENVVNMAFPGFGRNQHYVVVDDLLANKKPKALIIEVLESEKRESHKAAIYMANNKQAVGCLTAPNLRFVRDFMGFYNSRRQQIRDYLTGDWKQSSDTQASVESTTSWKAVDTVLSVEKMAELQIRLEKARKPVILPRKYWNIEYGLPLSMLEKIHTAAQKSGVPCYFLYVAHYGAPNRPDPYFMKIYHKYGEVLIPPSKIWNNPSYYCDSHHLNMDGGKVLSLWVANELAKRIH